MPFSVHFPATPHGRFANFVAAFTHILGILILYFGVFLARTK
jgi:hypothetical protein